MTDRCCQCSAAVSPDEKGLARKLINRGTTDYLCFRCMAARFDVPVAALQRKVEEFREMGCTLFAPPP